MYTHESSNNIEDSCNGELKPAFNNNNIPIAIAFASDNNYVKYLSVAIISLTDNMSKDYNYDIVILEDKIKDKSKLLLLEQVKDFKNVSLRFIDINRYFDKYKDAEFYTLENISYITRLMYSRFFIPEIFYNYNKVLYLDVDTLINDNLVELYQTDLENYLIAGAIHIENNPTFNYFNREITIKESKGNCSRVLPVSDSLLLDLKEHINNINMLENDYMFKKSNGKQYSRHFTDTYKKILKRLNIVTRTGKIPRLHDLRFTYAVKALEKMQQEGQDIYCTLPILSVYMGHKNIKSTEYYLQYTENTRNIIRSKIQDFNSDIFLKDAK